MRRRRLLRTECAAGCQAPHGRCVLGVYACDPAGAGRRARCRRGAPSANGCSGHGTCRRRLRLQAGWAGEVRAKVCPATDAGPCGGAATASASAGTASAPPTGLGRRATGGVPDGCSANGACVAGACKCDAGWTGANCASATAQRLLGPRRAAAPTPVRVRLRRRLDGLRLLAQDVPRRLRGARLLLAAPASASPGGAATRARRSTRARRPRGAGVPLRAQRGAGRRGGGAGRRRRAAAAIARASEEAAAAAGAAAAQRRLPLYARLTSSSAPTSASTARAGDCATPTCAGGRCLSGHGRCELDATTGGACACHPGWSGADCSKRVPRRRRRRWWRRARRRYCDEKAGECYCRAGWAGDACERASCAHNCGAHGCRGRRPLRLRPGWSGAACESRLPRRHRRRRGRARRRLGALAGAVRAARAVHAAARRRRPPAAATPASAAPTRRRACASSAARATACATTAPACAPGFPRVRAAELRRLGGADEGVQRPR